MERKDKNKKERLRPAVTVQGKTNQLIALATDRAEEQLRNGTASSQIIHHFLKLGSPKEKLELEILEKQRDLIVAKTKQVESTQRTDELYEKALKAFKTYSGNGDDEDERNY